MVTRLARGFTPFAPRGFSAAIAETGAQTKKKRFSTMIVASLKEGLRPELDFIGPARAFRTKPERLWSEKARITR